MLLLKFDKKFSNFLHIVTSKIICPRQNETGSHWVIIGVSCFFEFRCSVIVILKSIYQSSFGGEACYILIVIVGERPIWWDHASLGHQFPPWRSLEIDWLPYKIYSKHIISVGFDLLPHCLAKSIFSQFKSISDHLGKITLINSKVKLSYLSARIFSLLCPLSNFFDLRDWLWVNLVIADAQIF